MIVQLTGKLSYKSPTYVVIYVQDVGYGVKISLHTFTAIKAYETYTLFIYQYCKGDTHALYGFFDQEEKQWFSKLINVNGIGPSLALTVLSSLTTAELAQTIAQQQTGPLMAIKGIGKKAAQRIMIELKDKLSKADLEVDGAYASRFSADREAMAALIKLGIHATLAEKALKKVRQAHPEELAVEVLIKYALQY